MGLRQIISSDRGISADILTFLAEYLPLASKSVECRFAMAAQNLSNGEDWPGSVR